MTFYGNVRFTTVPLKALSDQVQAKGKLTETKTENRRYLPHLLSDKGFNDTVVNWALLSLHFKLRLLSL